MRSTEQVGAPSRYPAPTWLLRVLAGSLLASAAGGCMFSRADTRNDYVDCAVLQSTPTPCAGATPSPTAYTDLSEARLGGHVRTLAVDIGPRSYRSRDALAKAAEYIERELTSAAAGSAARVQALPYTIPTPWMEKLAEKSRRKCGERWEDLKHVIRSTEFRNIELTLLGDAKPGEVVVVGAHYDSDACESHGCNPGADDNGSGVAALLEVARLLVAHPTTRRTIKLVAFTNEEEPFFQTCAMGSMVYAARAFGARGSSSAERIVAMLSLETLGYYADEAGSQDYGALGWLAWMLDYPDSGNFLAFVGNRPSRSLAWEVLERFQSPAHTAGTKRDDAPVAFPAEAMSAWGSLPGVGWSDHWSFWQFGVPAVMATDTALRRNLCYHKLCDRPERLDYRRLAMVIQPLADTITWLANRASDTRGWSTPSRFAARCLEQLQQANPTPSVRSLSVDRENQRGRVPGTNRESITRKLRRLSFHG